MMTSSRVVCTVVAVFGMACGSTGKPATAEPAPETSTTHPAPTSTPPAADDCTRFVTKARPFMTDAMKAQGHELTDAEATDMAADCRKDANAQRDPVFRCVLDAPDDQAVRACFAQMAAATQSGARKTEASVALERISQRASDYYVAHHAFPKGRAAATPAIGCCQQPNHRCAAIVPGASPAWDAVGFQSEPSLFQYSYESDGVTAVAHAVADLDCDGTSIEYRLALRVVDGKPVAAMTYPKPNTD